VHVKVSEDAKLGCEVGVLDACRCRTEKGL